MEYFDLYDKDGNLLNKVVPRGSSLAKDEYHLIVHIWIVDDAGNCLIQQRNKDTDVIPYMWASTGGAATKGDTSLEAALRETYEELGISLEQNDFNLVNRYVTNHPYSNYITDVYLVRKSIPLSSLKLQKEEVKQCLYLPFEIILEMVNYNQFWDYKEMIQPSYFNDLERVIK